MLRSISRLGRKAVIVQKVNYRNSKFKDRSEIKSVLTDRILQCRVSEDCLKAEVHIPDLLCFDIAGKAQRRMHVWNIADVYEFGGKIALEHNFLDYQDICKNKPNNVFLLQQNISVKQRFHTYLNTSKQISCKAIPMRFILYVVGVGKSAITLKFDWFDSRQCKPLVRITSVLVYVNTISRKSIPLSDSFMQRAEDHGLPPLQRSEKSEIATLAVPDSNYHCYSVRVAHSDTDENGHTNHATYLRFCSDAASDGASKGVLTMYNTSVAHFQVQMMKVKYVRESTSNDVLHVYVWEVLSGSCLNFVCKKDGYVICEINVSF